MIKEKLDNYIKESLKSGDKVRLNTMRAVKTAFMEFSTAKGAKPLDDAAEISIVRKLVSQRLDASEQYKIGGRQDLVEKELAESKILSELLPKEPSIEEIETGAQKIITEKVISKMGIYIKELKDKFPTANGKTISEVVKKLLTS